MRKVIEINGSNFVVHYQFTEGEPSEPTLGNGDPGYPGSADTYDLGAVYWKGQDITELIYAFDLIDQIYDKL